MRRDRPQPDGLARGPAQLIDLVDGDRPRKRATEFAKLRRRHRGHGCLLCWFGVVTPA